MTELSPRHLVSVNREAGEMLRHLRVQRGPRTQRMLGWLAVAMLSLASSGCTTVKPWQRGTLADPIMQPDRDPMGQSLADHTYFSREAASGGRTVGGAGCGCN